MNRRRILSAIGSHMPTAKDYVQDGLVAMWDGIENAGWGVHDPNATVWKDLIGSNDCELTASAEFESNHLVSVNSDSYGAMFGFTPSGVTKEFTMKIPNVINRECQIIMFDGYNGLITGRPNVTVGGKGCIKCNGSLGAFEGAYYDPGIIFTLSKNSLGTFVDSLKSIGTTCFSYVTGSGGKIFPSTSRWLFLRSEIYCMRFYNRDITESEIAHNCAIDKARFNLPDAT